MTNSVRGWLEQLEAAGDDERLILLATVAGAHVTLDDDEAHGALRRAHLLLATGGSPLRALELDGRAVTALADDLDSTERRSELEAALAALCPAAVGLPAVEASLGRLAGNPALAFRAYACSLLAESLDA